MWQYWSGKWTAFGSYLDMKSCDIQVFDHAAITGHVYPIYHIRNIYYSRSNKKALSKRHTYHDGHDGVLDDMIVLLFHAWFQMYISIVKLSILYIIIWMQVPYDIGQLHPITVYRIFFSCDQAALWMAQSVCPSVCLSVCLWHLFHYVPVIISSWNFQELLPMTEVMSMQKVKGQGHRGHNPT